MIVGVLNVHPEEVFKVKNDLLIEKDLPWILDEKLSYLSSFDEQTSRKGKWNQRETTTAKPTSVSS